MVDLYVAKGASSGLWVLRMPGTVPCSCHGVTVLLFCACPPCGFYCRCEQGLPKQTLPASSASCPNRSTRTRSSTT